MLMLDKRMCILNESLLDNVDAEEVSDKQECKNFCKYRIIFIFNEESGSKKKNSLKNEVFIPKLISSFELFVKKGIISDYSFKDVEDGISDRNNFFMGHLNLLDVDIDAFNNMLMHLFAVIRSFSAYGRVDEIEIFGAKSYGEVDYVSLDISDNFQQCGCFDLNVYEFYSDMFGISDIEAIIKSIVQQAKKYDILKWANAEKNRTVIHSSTNETMYMLDDKLDVISTLPMNTLAFQTNEFQYDENGLMIVKIENNVYNIVDKDGNKKLADDYSFINDFKCGRAVVYRMSQHDYNFIDLTGKVISKVWYKHLDNFENGIALAVISTNVVGRDIRTYVDVNGNDICKGYECMEITNDKKYIRVKRKYRNKFNYIVVDDEHHPLVWKNCDYEMIYSYDNEYVCVCDLSKHNIYSFKEGRFLLKEWQDRGLRYIAGSKVCAICNVSWNFIDIESGKILFPDGFTSCVIVGDVYKVKKVKSNVDYFNLVDKEGNLVFDEFTRSLDYQKGGFWHKLDIDKNHNHKWQIVTSTGKVVDEYDGITNVYSLYVEEPVEGFSKVKKTMKDDPYGKHPVYNIIDSDGNYLIDEWFDSISDFNDGFFLVKKKSVCNILSTRTGKLLIPARTSIEPFFRIIEPYERVVVRNKKNQFNVFDKEGTASFGKFVDDVVSGKGPGVLRVGLRGLVDYEGNNISFV